MRIKITVRYILSACLFYYSHINAQITFNKTIDFANGDELGSSIVVVDGGYVITGNGWGYEAGNYFDEKLKYCKIDSSGNVIWKRFLGDSMISIYGGYECIQTFDGNLVLSAGIQYLDDFNADVFLLKFDPETGDTLFFRIYENESWQYANTVLEYTNGDLLMYSYDQNHYTCLKKTNFAGDSIWDVTIGAADEVAGEQISLFNDTLFLITFFDDCLPEGFTMREIDSSGSILTESFVSGDCITNGQKSLIGGIVGRGLNYPEVPFTSFIFRATADGDVLWEYNSEWDLDTLYDFGLQLGHFIELDNGNMFVTGYFAANPLGAYRGFVSKINADGEAYWERTYTSNGDNYDDNRLHDIALTPDGGIILAGAAYSNIYEEDQNFWVLKLDSMGCLTPGCDTLGDVVFELPFDEEIVLFPNPASDYFVIQSGENFTSDVTVEVMNLSGEFIQTHEIKKGSNSLIVNTGEIENGFYLVKIIDEFGRSETQKLIVSR